MEKQQRKNEYVAHALKVRKAVTLGDYHRLFPLYSQSETVGMAAYIMDKFIDKERIKALKVMMRA